VHGTARQFCIIFYKIKSPNYLLNNFIWNPKRIHVWAELWKLYYIYWTMWIISMSVCKRKEKLYIFIVMQKYASNLTRPRFKYLNKCLSPKYKKSQHFLQNRVVNYFLFFSTLRTYLNVVQSRVLNWNNKKQLIYIITQYFGQVQPCKRDKRCFLCETAANEAT